MVARSRIEAASERLARGVRAAATAGESLLHSEEKVHHYKLEAKQKNSASKNAAELADATSCKARLNRRRFTCGKSWGNRSNANMDGTSMRLADLPLR